MYLRIQHYLFEFQPLDALVLSNVMKSLPLMSTERCAKLMAVSMANNLDEVWIANHSALVPPYLNQYFPNFFRWYVSLCV